MASRLRLEPVGPEHAGDRLSMEDASRNAAAMPGPGRPTAGHATEIGRAGLAFALYASTRAGWAAAGPVAVESGG
jgi:hypothetical protein